MSSDAMTREAQIETLLREAEKLLKATTPGPWAWEWIGEKSNEWAVGQAWGKDGKAVEGEIEDDPGAMTDIVIERRLVGVNESGHANAADARFIARVRSLLPDLLAVLRSSAPQEWEEIAYRIEVFREEDGRYCATYETGDGKEAGCGQYSATPIGALAELCSTLIKVAEDSAHERVASLSQGDPAPQE